MRKTPVIVVIFMLMLCACSARNATNGVRRQIVLNYNRLDQALRQNDERKLLVAMEDLMADGPERDAAISDTRTSIANGGGKDLVRVLTLRTTILELVIMKDVALVTVEKRADSIRKDTPGEYGPKGLTHRINDISVYVDKWVRVRRNWRMLDETSKSEKVYIDGKQWTR
jgi:hypothetical protein